ncbi:MAG: class I SAM-dependent methyltransferase [Weeksellaceae bacterium]|jgi:ubiquinone/menaquinone biosynthesis C-methylase UbiE|nr:class I SAM-dependent methyltransferase [Weeksellaceae bacterium]
MNKVKFRKIWYGLSAKQRFLIRRLYFLPVDIFDSISGGRHKYVPPKGLIYTGYPANSEKFIQQGKLQLQTLIDNIDLRPNDALLDIGSGIGRTAIALTSFLNSQGSYDGFDVVKLGVDWCNSRLARDFSNFKFKYVPLYNDLYNSSKQKAENFVFPYKAESFDKIFSFSLFTHMQIEEIQNYFKEISRVLKKDGLAFSTFFLYDENDEKQIIDNGEYSFRVNKNGYKLMSDEVKAGNVAINKLKLRKMLEAENLGIVKIVDGFWKSGNKSNEFQDIVVFKRID